MKRIGILGIGTLIQMGMLFMLILPLYGDAAPSLPLGAVYGILYTDSILILAYGYFYFGCITFFFMGTMRQFLDEYGILLLSRGKAYSFFIAKQFTRVVLSVCVIYGMEAAVSLAVNSIFHLGFTVQFTSAAFAGAILWIVSVSVLVWLQMLLELFMSETVAVLIINLYGLLSIIIGARILDGGATWECMFFLNFAMYVRIQQGEVPWPWIVSSLAGHGAAISVLAYERIQRRDYL